MKGVCLLLSGFLEKHIIPKPIGEEDVPPELDIDWFKWLEKHHGKERRGRSTLSKWVCASCGLNVRIGIKADPELIHAPCGTVLVRGEKGAVYQAGGRADLLAGAESLKGTN